MLSVVLMDKLKCLLQCSTCSQMETDMEYKMLQCCHELICKTCIDNKIQCLSCKSNVYVCNLRFNSKLSLKILGN